MKRIAALLIALALLSGCACGEYWEDTSVRPVDCCDSRPGCQVLQTVMMGSFADFDPEDSLNVRVLSAALSRLTTVEEEDFAHFVQYFDVEPETLKTLYHVAVANCFRADCIVSPMAEDMDEQNARIVLMLFLEPGEESGEEMRLIRESATPEAIRMLAEGADVPVSFVEYLLLEQT